MTHVPRCPICYQPALARCNPCRATIRRRDGQVEEARIDGQVVFQRRPNAARALEYDGPQRAEVHQTQQRYSSYSPVEAWINGSQRQALTKEDAA